MIVHVIFIFRGDLDVIDFLHRNDEYMSDLSTKRGEILISIDRLADGFSSLGIEHQLLGNTTSTLQRFTFAAGGLEMPLSASFTLEECLTSVQTAVRSLKLIVTQKSIIEDLERELEQLKGLEEKMSRVRCEI